MKLSDWRPDSRDLLAWFSQLAARLHWATGGAAFSNRNLAKFRMSTLGQKQTFASVRTMSAFLPKADIAAALLLVRQGPRSVTGKLLSTNA
jgi:hypothetical protein